MPKAPPNDSIGKAKAEKRRRPRCLAKIREKLMNGIKNAFVLALFLTVFATPSSAQEESVAVSVSTTQEVYIKGEPIWLELRFDNRGTKDYSFSTADDYGINICWKLASKKQEYVKLEDNPIQGGIANNRTANVRPGGTEFYKLTLRERLRPEVPGTYLLRVKLTGRTFPTLTTQFRLKEPTKEDDEQFRKHIAQWGEGKDWEARESLLYTHSPVAVPLQNQLLDSVACSPELGVCVRSMLAGDPDASASLFVTRLANPKGNNNIRLSILYGVKSYGWNKLSDKSKQILAPYESAIAEAGPIGVGD
jgi:hypothetical protein